MLPRRQRRRPRPPPRLGQWLRGAAPCHSAQFLHPGTVLSEYCDLEYIDAPHRCSPADDEKLDPLITQVFEGPYHEWFNAGSTPCGSLGGGAVEYRYLEESLG